MARAKKPKPETEVRLEELQAAYMADPEDMEVFHKYFILLKAYARSLALKEIKTKVFLEPDHIDGVATEAVLKLFNQYRKEGWKVWGSFAGVLRWKVVEALYENAEEESSQSLNLSVGEEAGGSELVDILDRIGAKPLWKKESDNPQDIYIENYDSSATEVLAVLNEGTQVMSYRQSLLFHAYLLLRLRRPKTRLTLPAFKAYFLNTQEENAFELLLLEIRNRVAAHSS
jgi:hypothetical protein